MFYRFFYCVRIYEDLYIDYALSIKTESARTFRGDLILIQISSDATDVYISSTVLQCICICVCVCVCVCMCVCVCVNNLL